MADPILVFVPDGDSASLYGHYFFRRLGVADYLVSHGYRPIVLEGDFARFSMFAWVLARYDPRFIFTVGGHGAHNLLTGQGKEPVLAVEGESKEIPGVGRVVVKKGNAVLLAGRAVYTVSCHTARTLGRVAVERYGSPAYAGYSRSFVWVVGEGGRPEDDPYAGVFFECAFMFVRRLAEGHSFGEAYRATREAFLGAAEGAGDEDVSHFLRWDASILELWGDSKLTLPELFSQKTLLVSR